MRKIIVFTNLSLDGVMQAPGRQDEDLRGGFQFGGWGAPFAAMTYAKNESLANIGAYIFGRRTYEDFYNYWPKQSSSPYSEVLNNAQKYVASTTLKEPLPWQNSILLKGDVSQAVAELKGQPGKDFLIMGSGELIQTLMQHNLVDRFILLFHPLVLGTGRRLFRDKGTFATLKLLENTTTPTGVIIASYQPAER